MLSFHHESSSSSRFSFSFSFLLSIILPNLTFVVKVSSLSSSSTVQVWDNTLFPETLTSLHHEASQRGLGHNIFQRSGYESTAVQTPQKLRLRLSPLEQALDELLTQLNDTSPIVEYWSRQDWRHIEAHADIDELLVRNQQKQQVPIKDLTFRYPTNGHVLYLQVGSSVQGPTCLFPTCTSGGDLLKLKLKQPQSQPQQTDNDNDNHDDSHPIDIDVVPLITVPAVPSRLLRFQGDILHAVPRPVDLWFRKFVQGTGETEPTEEWGRSVILFNTWNDTPPHDVLPLDHHNDNNNDNDNQSTSEVCEETKSNERLGVRKKNEWKQQSVDSHDDDDDDDDDNDFMEVTNDETQNNEKEEETYAAAKIWLLGDYARRNATLRTVKLFAPETQTRKALEHKSKVYQTFLIRS